MNQRYAHPERTILTLTGNNWKKRLPKREFIKIPDGTRLTKHALRQRPIPLDLSGPLPAKPLFKIGVNRPYAAQRQAHDLFKKIMIVEGSDRKGMEKEAYDNLFCEWVNTFTTGTFSPSSLADTTTPIELGDHELDYGEPPRYRKVQTGPTKLLIAAGIMGARP